MIDQDDPSSRPLPNQLDFELRQQVSVFMKNLHADFAEGRLADCLTFFSLPCVIVNYPEQDVQLISDNLSLRNFLSDFHMAYLATGVVTRDVKVVEIERGREGVILALVDLHEFNGAGIEIAASRIRYRLKTVRGSHLIEVVEQISPHPRLNDLVFPDPA